MSITASERLDQIKVTVALFNAAPGAVYLTNFVPFAGNTGALITELVNDPAFTAIYPTYLTDLEFAGRFIDSLIGGAVVGGTNPAATIANAKSYYAARLAAGETRAQVAQDLIHDLGITSESDTVWGNVAKQFNNKVAVAEYYSVDLHGSATNVGALQAVVAGVTAATPVATAADKNAAIVAGDSTATPGQVLKITAGTSGTADVLGLTGDQDVRIDFTNPANQIKGLDLNGDGVIANDGKENAITGKASNYEIVDAYSRNPLNELDRAHNFLGDIAFDGTGFQGDGVNTDGNIVLGGLGVDTIFGGIGNDFLTGGGIASARIAQARDAWIAKWGSTKDFVAPADTLSGGRNADFFFVELSALDNVDGNNINIDGGTTADDNAAGITQSKQDADWLLFEGSDDDEPTTITLRDDSTLDVGSDEDKQTDSGSVVTRSGKQVGTLKDIENFDASGNLYGFLNNLSAKLGGAGVDGRVVQAAGQNNGIGSSAQLKVIGSEVANIIIGGYDNDHIEGNGGNDILLGGNLAYLINPNLLAITNDGKDELFGGDGDDHIVFEADGGTADGGNHTDTLWITNLSLGTKTAADLTTDSVLRFDLKAQNLDDAAGYGGADKDRTQDQTNYKTEATRTTVSNFENVIATGLGAIDYDTDGTNAGDIAHTSQMNIGAYHGDLTLRGTDSVNVLYANTGNDVLEGRQGGTLTFDNTGKVTADGRDKLSGGDGLDDFIFGSNDGLSVEGGKFYGDGVDVIHRQADLNGDNIWDGYDAKTGVGNFVQDFGVNSTSLKGSSALTVDFGTTNLALADVAVTSFSIKIAGTTFAVADQAALAAANNATELAALVNAAFHAQDANVTAVASGNTVVITDTQGRDISDTISEGYLVGVAIANGAASAAATFAPAGTTTLLDRLIYASYEDRADGELTDDDAVLGSRISLGIDAYAQDRVVSFSADGTRIAEDQKYNVIFTNLTTQDKVTLKVNGVEYTLQVGVNENGKIEPFEDGVGDAQDAIQAHFLTRFKDFINDSFADRNTAAGKIYAEVSGGNTLTITQDTYGDGEQTVFMSTPTVTLENLSGGQVATAVVVNNSQHEVQLLDFDGRDGKLNAENVLFIGDSGASRSILATAKAAGGALNGSDAVLVDGGANDLAGIAQNTATNAFLATNFSVHGDDLLIGGAGVDVINAGTGDDRVIGSLGNDTIDGGKDYYEVQVLGEAEKRVVKLNDWEAKNVSQVTELAGLTISSVTLIAQTQDGTNLDPGAFKDTLQFQQADFGSNAQFTITLDNFKLNGSVIAQNNGGAGKVSVDVNADGVFESTTSFTNFEYIRTVSGTGKAVANAGQGNDTLDVSALSTATGGISYDLTKVAGEQGFVRYGTDAAINAKALAKGNAAAALASASVASVKAAILGEQATNAFIAAVNAIPVTGSTTVAGFLASVSALADLTRPTSTADVQSNVPLLGAVTTDYETKFIAVDGVENVIGGNGNDLLLIDDTEAAKNNSFSAGLGVDRVEYRNEFNSVDPIASEPTITINVNWNGAQADANTDTVVSTGGRVGTTVATDTLSSVEYITLNNNTARGSSEADLLNVSNVAGSVTDYTNGQIRTSYKANTNVQLTVEGLEQVEKVKGAASSNDTVIVGSKADFAANAGSDVPAPASEKPLEFASFLDYDDLTAKQKRIAFGDDTSKITKTLNQKEYTFDLGAGGSDTVDYSKTADVIAAVVDFKNSGEQYVLVGVDDSDLVDAGDRVDQLKSVENVVASQARSILDLTGAASDLKITFSNNFDDTKVSSWDANFEAGKYGREVHQIKVANALTGTSIVDTNYLDYVYVDTNATDTTALPANARWTDIEGSDKNETVEISAYEAGVANYINLRGGNNKVTYEGTKLAAVIEIVDYDANNAATTGLIQVTATHTAVADDHNASTVTDPTTSANDTIKSYSQQNGIEKGVLTIKATRGGEDSFQFGPGTTADKLYVFGGAVDATPSINVRVGAGAKANSLELIGFESVQDSGASDDVYDIVNLAGISPNLKLSDDLVTADHDTLKVGNGAAALDGDAASIINLGGLRLTANNTLLAPGNFNTFEVLDVTNVTGAAITSVIGSAGLTDELVVGKLDGIASATLFESLVVTQDFLTQNGTSIVLDTTTNKVIAGSKSLNVDASLRTVSVGGIALDGSFSQDSLLTVAGNVSLSATGTGAATLIGGDGNDTITGGAGSDTLYGGRGNDTLDGGTATEVRQLNVTGVLDAPVGGSVTLTFDGDGVGVGTYAVTVVEGTEIVAGAGNDAVGAALAAKVNANLAALNTAALWNNGAQLLSATYDNSTDLMTFRFTSGVDVTGTITAAKAGEVGGTLALSTETVVSEGGNGGIDTFVFGGSSANNGVDTINGFVNGVGGDVLNVSAFLGATVAPLVPGLNINAAAAGIDLTGAENVGVIFNKANAQLVSSDIASAFAADKVAVENNSKAVLLVTADADGIGGGADVTNNPYNVYFVEDTDTGAGTNFAVTLVGTINSTAELSALNFVAGNFA